LIFLLASCLFSPGLWAQHHHAGNASLDFIPNQGQWEQDFEFKIPLASGALFLEDDAWVWNLRREKDWEAIHDLKDLSVDPPPGGLMLQGHAFKVRFPGSQTREIIPLGNAEETYHNYYLGNDPAKWQGGVPLFSGASYREIFPGINLNIYDREGQIKYDFIVQPQGRIRNIRMEYSDDIKLRLVNEQLHIIYSGGKIIEEQPIAYQIIGDKKEWVKMSFKLWDNNTVGFEALEKYDTRFPLIIDPVLVFATFSGSTSDNWGYSATYDEDGHLYGAGIVFGTGYPTTLGVYQESFGGGSGALGCDVGVSKYSPDGSSQIWATYLGGGSNEFPHSLIVNSSDELYIYGSTASSDFPTTVSAFDNSFDGGAFALVTSVEFPSGSDIFISRLSTDATNLLASTYIGGSENDGLNIAGNLLYNYGDHARGEIILDPSENPVVASSTYSVDFPIIPGAYDNSPNGLQDGVIFGMDPNLSTLNFSSFMGGSGDDGAYSVKVDVNGDLLLCGGTRSTNFPTTPGSYSTIFNGGVTDGWVARMNSTASSLIASTYLGTAAYDQAYFVDHDDDGEVYVTGQSIGPYPVTAGVYSNTGATQFISKLDPNLNGFIYSTVFGSVAGTSVNMSPTAFLVDVCENVYVSGWGGSVNNGFNSATGFTLGMPLSADAFQSSSDGSDFYFFVLAKNGINLLYGSYFGGGTSGGTVVREHVDGGTSRFDKQGIIYQAVCAGCGGLNDFPVTPGAYSELNLSTNCNLGSIKFEFDLSGVLAESNALPAISGCAPFTVDFENTSSGAVDYVWNFGDGGSSTDFEPTYTYNTIGTYSVELVAIDSNSCNIADTSYLTIIVGLDSIIADLDYSSIQNCDSLFVDFANLSTVIGPGTNYYWDLGDGNSSTDSVLSYTYTAPGVYEVQLIIEDSSSCNLRDTAFITIDYSTIFESGFTADWTGCIPVDAQFEADFADADSYFWDFGDGNTATGISASNIYNTPGNYSVILSTTDCGITVTDTQTVVVPPDPTAFFDDDPFAAIVNTPVSFTNLSTDADSYIWDFGDGSTSADVNPTHVYAAQGTFTVCLTARNGFGCEDIYCRPIDIEFDGIVDVPTAFTPNGDGINDVFQVQGFGINQYQFRIFNRWGEMVFESFDINEAWDGFFRGEEQAMEVYVWTLSVVFANGRDEDQQGNLTLLR
jgi:gliding motility-associated-like protein